LCCYVVSSGGDKEGREGAYVFQAVRILVSLSTTTAFERFPGIHVHFLDLGASPHLGGFGGWRIYVFRE
jgi:hypothetical protein